MTPTQHPDPADLAASLMACTGATRVTVTDGDSAATVERLRSLSVVTGHCPACNDERMTFEPLDPADRMVTQAFAGPNFDDPIPAVPMLCGGCGTIVDHADIATDRIANAC